MDNGNNSSAEFVPIEIGGSESPKKSKKWLWIILIILLLAGAGGGVYWWLSQRPAASPPKSSQQNQNKPSSDMPKIADDPLYENFVKPTTGETWSERKSIAPMGLTAAEKIEMYQCPTCTPEMVAAELKNNMPSYFEVGKRGNNTIILVLAAAVMGGERPYLFEKAPDGSISYIVFPQTFTTTMSPEEQKQLDADLTSEVDAQNTTIHYDSLSVPGYLVLPSNEKVLRGQYERIGVGGAAGGTADGDTRIKIADYGKSKLYRLERKYTDTRLTNIGYYLETPIGTTMQLDYAPHTRSLAEYTWSNKQPANGPDENGKLVFDEMSAIARGCGSMIAAVTRSDELKDTDLEVVGKTDEGRDVYQPKNKQHELWKKAYGEYTEWQKTLQKPAIAFEAFVASHSLVVIKNQAGELLVYVRQQLAPSYGCAKPVVYLYPTTTQTVNVAVGAQVKVSDPLYPEGGWQDVLAKPNGELTYEGRQYTSLFWEGTGFGDYPGITKGTVVKRSQAERTIRQQLQAQGLNTQEITDFMDFWTEKIPNKPYIRLTWLSTAQLDRLAPLTITPRPDTIKRVFLDMAGFDHPIKLPAQKLEGFTRRGFTVVEWGGLTQQ